MSDSLTSDSLTLESAQALLRQFTYPDRVCEKLEAFRVQAALRLVVQHSDYQIFGVCADTQPQAIAALHAYLTALGYATHSPEAVVETSVYIKCNLKTGLCYAAPYVGEHRGVLISCQSAYEGEVNETFGHLPLGLFQIEG